MRECTSTSTSTGRSTSTGFAPAKLNSALDAVHRAGVPGVYAEVRDVLDPAGEPRPHPIDGALLALYRQALCRDGNPETDPASLSPAPS
ncbi:MULTISPECIES: hypothetical protein [unclassified Streptomyces]|uniref:hypothetical protein n=1 Tax=unclassified Streptomyces TaxID=2593676 RepID=UPI000AE9E21A|nr:hypothetical protein [Streptomyces sp. TSRI0107]